MFKDIYKDKKVLITGNTGFKGTWLTIWLKKLGAEVIGISKDIPTEPSMFKTLRLAEKIEHHFIDVRHLTMIKEIVNNIKPDFVFHLAAQPIVADSYSDPVETITTNVQGTMNVLEVLREMKNKCTAVIITSDKCYDNVEWVWGYKETDRLGGKDIYSGSKAAAEMIFKSYYYSFFKNRPDNKVRIVSVRAGNVIGGGDWAKFRIVPDCIRAWSEGRDVEVRNPESTRPWQHVLEPLSGYLSVGQQLDENENFNGESYNFGPDSDTNKTVKELLVDLSKTWSYDIVPAVFSGTNSGFHEARLLKLNCDKSLFHLKWIPTLDFRSIIEFTGSWYYNFYKEQINMYDFTINQIAEFENKAVNKDIEWTK